MEEKKKPLTNSTRPHTWPPFLYKWVGAQMQIFSLNNSIIMDQPTDLLMDKRVYKVEGYNSNRSTVHTSSSLTSWSPLKGGKFALKPEIAIS